MRTDQKRAVIPTFAEVAKLIAPNNTQRWLPAHLEWWAQGVRYDRIFDECQPTRESARGRLAEFAAAARLIERELNNPGIRTLLDGCPTSNLPISSWSMRDLASRADQAFLSPLLTAADGSGKRGRGKPKIPGIFDARTALAGRIVVMWQFFRGNVLGIGNLEAAAAAQAYWLSCGGKSGGYGNPLNGWYDYFKCVRDNSTDPGLKLLIWQRDLKQADRRGGPPWFLGTYFPADRTEFKSPVSPQ